jgi:nucleotide-binding universal stress UspA family protein
VYRKILVAIDETDSAARAAREAIALARATGAALCFLHVGVTRTGDNALALARAFAQGAGLSVTTACVAADGETIGEKVVQEAERWGADLIVAGRHNRGTVERMLLGSVSAAIVRAAELPVLLVRRVTPTPLSPTPEEPRGAG